MPGKPFPPDLLKQARRVLDALRKIEDQNPTGHLNAGALAEALNLAEDIQAQLIGLANQLTALRNRRDAVHMSIWDQVKRSRATVRGVYGDDSTEYELVGGTRSSERKSPRRRRAAAE